MLRIKIEFSGDSTDSLRYWSICVEFYGHLKNLLHNGGVRAIRVLVTLTARGLGMQVGAATSSQKLSQSIAGFRTHPSWPRVDTRHLTETRTSGQKTRHT